jgi:DNA-directed RNA polymerase specialized sigma24 family protein
MTTTPQRDTQVARFYAEHAHGLEHAVARRVHAPHATIEDACQIAWAILLRRPDVTLDQCGLAWLATVAAREGWRLASGAHEVPAGAFLPGDPEPGVLPEPPADAIDAADRAVARDRHAQRVDDLARLKPRERQALYLKALGYRYQEIAALTDSTYTAVNRRITEGRARLRALARERDAAAHGAQGGEPPPDAG